LNTVEGAFGRDVDYDMLVKFYGTDADTETRYSSAECIGCQTAAISGHPNPQHIAMSYVQRQNLTMRMQMRRFTRLTNALSKKVENLMVAVALHYMQYNLRRHDPRYGNGGRAHCAAIPWQNPFAERLVGSIRHECLDHAIVWNERSLHRTLQSYFAYYQRPRTHLALGKDAPEPRVVEPPEQGRVVAIPQVGGNYTTDTSAAPLSGLTSIPADISLRAKSERSAGPPPPSVQDTNTNSYESCFDG
jgi:hypothetical protein